MCKVSAIVKLKQNNYRKNNLKFKHLIYEAYSKTKIFENASYYIRAQRKWIHMEQYKNIFFLEN